MRGVVLLDSLLAAENLAAEQYPRRIQLYAESAIIRRIPFEVHFSIVSIQTE